MTNARAKAEAAHDGEPASSAEQPPSAEGRGRVRRAPGREQQSTKATTPRQVTVKAATPWGPATVVEEIRAAQRAGDKRFASVVQLLEGARGEVLVRIAYTTDGVARRGPVTLRLKDLERLRAAASSDSPLTAALGWAGGDA
jgi:hypothetical protein